MTPRPTALPPVVSVSRWSGFCLPCGRDDRPLVLTWTGRRGLRAWLAGDTWVDGRLLLTCTTCGGTDAVGWEPEPEPVVEVSQEAPVEVATETECEPVVEEGNPDAPEHERLVRPDDLPAQARVVDLRPTPHRTTAPALAGALRSAPSGAEDDVALDLLHLAG